MTAAPWPGGAHSISMSMPIMSNDSDVKRKETSSWLSMQLVSHNDMIITIVIAVISDVVITNNQCTNEIDKQVYCIYH
jgi:hypothetical protein